MAELVTCANCGQRLRVPDELLGKKVKCPGCGTTFTAETSPVTAPAPPSPPAPPPPEEATAPSPPNLSLDDEPQESPGPPPLGTPQSVSPTPPSPAPAAPAAPAASAGGENDLEPCPFCGERIRKGLLRCPYCEEALSRKDDGEQHDEEEQGEARPWERRGRRPRVRRDCEPHRGSLILTLGIVSIPLALVAASCSCCSYGIGGIAGVIGLALAIPAWVMGHRDLAKMQAGTMDPEGQGSTQGGMICGIIGTALNALGLLLAIIMLIFLIVVLATSGGPGGGPFAPVPPPPPPPPVKGLKKVGTVVPRLADYLPHRFAPKG
jgi:predicted Zn finger-like uncharacterized protein